MYLLIPFLKAALDASSTYLHPTMYLLIPTVDIIKQYIQSHLHPTMYLLILVPGIFQCRIEYIFTSHYVSINSRTPVGSLKKACLHLHPTMYLLIR